MFFYYPVLFTSSLQKTIKSEYFRSNNLIIFMPKSTQLDFIMGLLVETFIITISFPLSISSLMTCLKSSSYSHFTIYYSLFPLARLDIFGRHWLHQLVSSRPRMTKVLDWLDIFCIAAHDSFWFIYHGVSRSPSHHFHLTFLADFKLRDMSFKFSSSPWRYLTFFDDYGFFKTLLDRRLIIIATCNFILWRLLRLISSQMESSI